MGRGFPATVLVHQKCRAAHNAVGSVGRAIRKQNLSLNFKADYIEHHFEARAMLPPICDTLCNQFFCFHADAKKYLSETDADFNNE